MKWCWMVLVAIGVPGLAWADGLEPPAGVRDGVSSSWAELAAQVEAGALTLDPGAAGRLVERAVRALDAGQADADLLISAVVGRRLAAFRRADGTLDWARAADAGLLEDDAHVGLPLFLDEAAQVIKTGDPSRIDAFADALSQSDTVRRLGVVAAGRQYTRRVRTLKRQGLLGRLRQQRRVHLRNGLLLGVGLSLILVADEADALGGSDPFRMVLPVSGAAIGTAVGHELRAIWRQTTGLRLTRPAAYPRWLRPLRVHRGVQVAAFVGELAVTWITAEFFTALVVGPYDTTADDQVGLAASRLRDVAQGYALGDVDADRLAEEVASYQQAWATYRNALYQPLAEAEETFAQAIVALDRDAQRRRAELDARRAQWTAYPRLFQAHIRAQGAAATSLEAHLDARADADAAAWVEAWLEASEAYARRRTLLLQRIYVAHVRAQPWAIEPGDDFEASARRWVRGHTDFTRNRLQTYADERVALTFLFDRLLGGRPELGSLRQRALRLTARQAELDGALFAARPQAGGLAEVAPAAGLADALR